MRKGENIRTWPHFRTESATSPCSKSSTLWPRRCAAKVRDAGALPATGTKRSRLLGKIFPTGVADRNARVAAERAAADSAVRRQEHGSYTVQEILSCPGTSQHANNCSPGIGLAFGKIHRQPVTLTAEGAPHSRANPAWMPKSAIASEYTMFWLHCSSGSSAEVPEGN